MINVPSFIQSVEEVRVKDYGRISVHVAFGGNYYGIVSLEELGVRWREDKLGMLVKLAREIWGKIDETSIVYPEIPGIRGLYGIRFVEEISRSPYKAYGILIFGSKNKPLVDRSPSGTGTSAHLAYLHYTGKLRSGEEGEFISAIGTVFRGRIVGRTNVGSLRAITPEIATRDKGGYITGYAT